jgi:hypothetical protein
MECVMASLLHVLGDLDRFDTIPTDRMWDKSIDHGFWCRGDFAYFKANTDRIRAALNALPINLNVGIYTSTCIPGGRSQLGKFKEELGNKLVDPQAITVVLSHNVTGGTPLPMTPWIIVHRLAHAWQFASEFKHFETLVALKEGELLINYLRQFVPAPKRKSTSMPQDWRKGIAYLRVEQVVGALMTTQAARQGEIFSEVDADADLFAQYLFNGGVRLLDFEYWDERIAAFQKMIVSNQCRINFTHETHRALQLMRDVVNPQEMNQVMRATERAMNTKIAHALQKMKGHVLTF